MTVVDDSRLQFEDGDNVTFKEVGGLAINDTEKPAGFPIKTLGPYTFQIEGLPAGQYTTGGYATQVKKTKVLNFVSFCNISQFQTQFNFSKSRNPLRSHLLHQENS